MFWLTGLGWRYLLLEGREEIDFEVDSVVQFNSVYCSCQSCLQRMDVLSAGKCISLLSNLRPDHSSV